VAHNSEFSDSCTLAAVRTTPQAWLSVRLNKSSGDPKSSGGGALLGYFLRAKGEGDEQNRPVSGWCSELVQKDP
jgi:hypothetical protein